ncbi:MULTISPECIES: type VI secretion system baseplate subunit TssG [unclassified Myroides]|uniref:type VI secretion system baseplate subunit TssG n=1 Tax=unclassified Myroides TaxID=2642485 RepID=UPI003D2F5FF3
MNDFNQLYLQDFNSLYTDYKTEVIAYHIWKYYHEIDGVYLKRLGGNSRSFSKDLKRIKAEYIEVKKRIISVESFREGIYDYLPEGLFHVPSFRSSRENITDVVEQIRQEKRVEQKARAFFQPFELEVYFCHLKALDLAYSFDKLTKEDELFKRIEELWPLLKLVDDKNAQIFACLLPNFHAERGKKTWIEKCLTACLEVPVNISFVPSEIAEFEQFSSTLVLDAMCLGINCVLLGTHADGEKDWHVEIGPIRYDNLHKYLEGSPLRILLQTIYDHCLPLAVAVIETFITQREEESFRLMNNNNSLLGYSTYL